MSGGRPPRLPDDDFMLPRGHGLKKACGHFPSDRCACHPLAEHDRAPDDTVTHLSRPFGIRVREDRNVGDQEDDEEEAG